MVGSPSVDRWQSEPGDGYKEYYKDPESDPRKRWWIDLEWRRRVYPTMEVDLMEYGAQVTRVIDGMTTGADESMEKQKRPDAAQIRAAWIALKIKLVDMMNAGERGSERRSPNWPL